MRYTIVCIFFYLISGDTLGEEFRMSGKVRDKTLSQPLAGAVVQIFSSRGKALYSATITNAAGDFTISIPATGRKFELRATFAGYVHYSIKLKRATFPANLLIEMEEDLHTYSSLTHRAAQKMAFDSIAPSIPAKANVPSAEKAVLGYAIKDPVEQAAYIAKTMKSKLDLSPSQQVVVAVIQEKYLMALSQLAASGTDNKTTAQQLKSRQKERNQQLEAVLTELQYEKWMRHLEKQGEG